MGHARLDVWFSAVSADQGIGPSCFHGKLITLEDNAEESHYPPIAFDGQTQQANLFDKDPYIKRGNPPTL